MMLSWYKEPKLCQENIPHNITLSPAWTVNRRQDALFMSNSDPIVWMSQRILRLIRSGNVFSLFYCPILVIPCELLSCSPALSWKEWHSVTVTVAFLSVPTSDLNKTFSLRELPLNGYFLFFWNIFVNPGDPCVAVSKILKQPCHIQRHVNIVSSHSIHIHSASYC